MFQGFANAMDINGLLSLSDGYLSGRGTKFFYKLSREIDPN